MELSLFLALGVALARRGRGECDSSAWSGRGRAARGVDARLNMSRHQKKFSGFRTFAATLVERALPSSHGRTPAADGVNEVL